MAFNRSFIKPLIAAMRLISNREATLDTQKKMLSIGYPDLFLNNESIQSLPQDAVKYTIENKKALKWHGLSDRQYTYLSIEQLVQEYKWSFEYLDIHPGTGDTQNYIQVDLNQPIPENLYCGYDLIIDSGSAEHCFNIAQVFENYFHMLKPGGILLQYMPFLSPNHGFWSINPTVIYDLAKDNPIKILECNLSAYSSYRHYFDNQAVQIPFSPVGRFTLDCASSQNIILMFFAYKKLAKSIFTYPIQSKYRQDK